MTTQGRLVRVCYPASRDIWQWERDHGRGLVPDAWPYGLDRLKNSAYRVTPVAVSKPAGVAKRVVAELSLASQSACRPGSDEGIELAWDENTAVDLALQRAHRFGRRVSGVIWGTDVPKGLRARARSWGVWNALASCDLLWCLSKPQIDLIHSSLGRNASRVEFLRFGVDIDFFRASPLPHRRSVLSLGGDRDRDTATLFMALEQVASANPDVDVLVQTRSSLRPPKGVRLVKHMSHAEVRNAYAAASVVVVATRMNSHVSGMTVSLEAGASARPVVITKTPGIEDYVIDQVTGLLSPVGNPQSLARHVNALLQDEQRCSEMGIRARAYVAHRHSSKAMVESIGEMICDL